MADDADPHQNWARSKAAAQRALKLDSTLASPHNTLGYIHHWYDWDFPAAEREFRRALELDPAYSVAHYDYGRFLVTMGRIEEGIVGIRRAIELDPLTSWVTAGLGDVLVLAERYDEAIRVGRATVELDPGAPFGHAILWQAYVEKGMAAQAFAEHRAMAKSDPGDPWATATLAYIHARTGGASEARKLLADVELSKRALEIPPSFAMARAYVALGDRDAAFRWLERARRDRHGDIPRLKIDPRLDPIRSDPRFAALLKTVGFH
jgi:tetratricopeptide (TPR) repeat protein